MSLRAVLACALISLSCKAASQRADDSGLGWRMVALDLELEIDPTAGRMRGRGGSVLELDGDASLGPSLGVNARGPLMRLTSVVALPAVAARATASAAVPRRREARRECPRDASRCASARRRR